MYLDEEETLKITKKHLVDNKHSVVTSKELFEHCYIGKFTLFQIRKFGDIMNEVIQFA